MFQKQQKITDLFGKPKTSEESSATKSLPSSEKNSETVKGTFENFPDSQGPDYPDLFQTCDNDFRKDSFKTKLLTGTWEAAYKFDFPFREVRGTKRKLKGNWLGKHTWMKYSMSCDAVYCAPCVLFGSQRDDAKERTFTKLSPVTDWSNLSKYVSRHLSEGSSHHDNVRASERFLRMQETGKADIMGQLSSYHQEVIERNRHILGEIIRSLLFCARQNIAIRGHEEGKGNFPALLHLQAQKDPILAAHLESADMKAKYTSPMIQNELLDICADQIRKGIVDRCNAASFYGFIADEATDCSTKEQIALCVRFFDKESGNICEEFLGFQEAESTTGEHLANKFISSLEEYGIVIDRMRGQGYDGAANMAGKHRGVQAKIRERVPQATYTHCRAHSLNLSVVHACKEPLIRNLMDTVQTISFAFDYSAKRLKQFNESLSNDNPTKEQMERKTKLQTLCETRWFSRVDALTTFKKCYNVIIDALEELSEDGDAKARSYVCSIKQFDFLIALVTSEHVLTPLNPLSAVLQGKTQDLLEAAKESKTVISMLRAERVDDDVWEGIFEEAVAMGVRNDVQPSVPRFARRQCHRGNVPGDTPSEYWKRNLYLPFVDHLVNELNDRLVQNENRFSAQYLLPSQIGNITRAKMTDLYDTFGEDLPANDKNEFQREVDRWKARWTDVQVKPETLGETLVSIKEPLFYPNIFKCLEMLACMPVTSATAERCFSVMRRLKTYLRSTMTGQRMSSLAGLHIYRDTEVNVSTVISEFAEKKQRRLAFLFQ